VDRVRLGVIVALVIGCGSSQPPSSPPPPPPPPSPSPPPPQPRSIEEPPPGSFAQPPPGNAAPAPAPAPAPTPLPAALPLVGPECSRNNCPTTAPLYPTEQCTDKIHIGGRGPCVRFASGCNWSGLVCPAAGAACGPSDCDLPVPAVWLCPDRKTVARFECVRAKTGRCGATYQACPASAMSPPPAIQPPPPPRPPPTPCPVPLPSDRVLATWPIVESCSPGSGPAPPPIKELKRLGDGTRIIESLGRCNRVRFKQCYTKCLPPTARIATPSGDLAARDVRIGTIVWTRDASGTRVAAAVVRVSSPLVDREHHVARLRLADGRTLVASPEHPVPGGRLQDLRIGERYDGSTIIGLALERFAGDHTYDLLPAGDTGIYWADGIPIGSTLGPDLFERTDRR
jgi:hypothetical protein